MMGMARIKRGDNFNGVVKYAFLDKDGKGRGELVGGNTSAQDMYGIAREMKAAASARPDIKKPVWHQSLSAAPGERLRHDQWRELADDYMERMGFSGQLYAVVLHDEPGKCQHVHIVASRISSLDRTVYLGQNENLKSSKLLRELEVSHGLYQVQSREKDPNRIRMSRGEQKRNERLGVSDEPATYMQYHVGKALQTSRDMLEFIGKVEEAGIDVQVNASKAGRINGFAFQYQDVRKKSSDLRRDLSFTKIAKKLNYRQIGEEEGLTSLEQARNTKAREMLMDRARGGESENPDFAAAKEKANKTRSALKERAKKMRRLQVSGLQSASFVKHRPGRVEFVEPINAIEKFGILRERAAAARASAATEKAREAEEKRLDQMEREAAAAMKRQAKERASLQREADKTADRLQREAEQAESEQLAERQSKEREISRKGGPER